MSHPCPQLRRVPTVVRAQPAAGGFTLIEAVAVFVVLGILASLGAFAYQRVARDAEDTVGKPILALAQVEARRVAAGNGYVFPATLADQLTARAPAMADGTDGRQVAFTTGPSYAPGTGHNPDAGYLVSVAVAAGHRAAFTVETSAAVGTGHCWAVLDDLTATGTDATTWGYTDAAPAGQCTAPLVLACPALAAGTAADPTDLGTLGTCPAPAGSGPVAAPRCVTAALAGPADPTAATVTWTPPTPAAAVTGYTVLAFTGAVDPTRVAPGDAAVRIPVPGAGADTATVPGLAPGVRYTFAVTAAGPAGTASTIAAGAATQDRLPVLLTVPAAVTGLDAAADPEAKTVRVTWTGVPGAETYRVERATDAGGYQLLGTVPATDPAGPGPVFTDTHVDFGSTYTYRVTPAAADPAPSVCGTVLHSAGPGPAAQTGPVTVLPAAPTLSGAASGDQVTVSWVPVGAVDSYLVSRHSSTLTWTVTGGPGSYTVVQRDGDTVLSTTTSTELAIVDTGLPASADIAYSATATAAGADGSPVTSAASPTLVVTTGP